jgi:hypothetical protein
MRQFKPKNSLDFYKLGGRSKHSYSNKNPKHATYQKRKMIIEANKELAEKQKDIPKGKWFE